MRRLRLEAQYVAVGNVVGDRGQIAFETLRVAELEVFATCEPSSGLRDVLLEAFSGGDCGYLGEPKWWRKKAETIPELFDRLFIEVDLWVVRSRGSYSHALGQVAEDPLMITPGSEFLLCSGRMSWDLRARHRFSRWRTQCCK